MKKIISILCCALMLISSFMISACGDPDSKKTKIFVEIKAGGTGEAWLTNAGKRFADKVGNYSYESGKEGVVIMPDPVESFSIKNAETSATNIYDLMSVVDVENYARGGKILCIDDVLTTKSDTRDGIPISPLEKISEEQRSRYMYDGHYYGGPTCEYYPTITYDRNLFNKYSLYFASPEEIAMSAPDELLVCHESSILADEYYFLPRQNASNYQKSCGPDGTYGTEDDGLPSSLLELIALCEYMKNTYGIHPFNFPGSYKYYSNFLLSALYTSLQGYDNARGNYEFTGEIEIVVGFEDDYLFPGVDEKTKLPISTVRKPITKTVTITEETGYYTSWEIEKYYAEAFMDLCVKQSWFGPSATNNDDQRASMQKFVFSDAQDGDLKIAMLLDGTYWYNEANEIGKYFEMLENYLIEGYGEPRDVRVMPLPVNLTETVAEGEGKPQTLLEMNYGMFVINNNVQKNPGLMQACKDFLTFMYTDDELSKYTATTSILRSMNYTLKTEDEETISTFGSNLINVVSNSDYSKTGLTNKVVYFSATNDTFKKGSASFEQSWLNPVFAADGYPTLYEALHTPKSANLDEVHEIFCSHSLSKAIWQAMYKGNSVVGDIDGLTSLSLS